MISSGLTSSARMHQTDTNIVDQSRRSLVQRIASSSYLNKSARLREMFLYLCRRVLEDAVEEIHEQEVGRNVFGRPADYDTSSDNIVRVHASMLRKRVDQYFAAEGQRESTIIDIPRGNYAPVFRKRPAAPPETAAAVASVTSSDSEVLSADDLPPLAGVQQNWKIWLPSALAVILACVTVFLLVRANNNPAKGALFAKQSAVRQLWSQLFRAGSPTDIVLDDSSLGVFQELTAHQITLEEYFDRSYLRSVEASASAAQIDPDLAKALILKRQSSYADVSLFSKLNQIAGAMQGSAKSHFARDYSFREVKANNSILLGNSRSNPWIEPFESHLGLRWRFDKSQGGYYPVDLTAPASEEQKFHVTKDANKPHQGYATVSLLPNLSGTGKVLVLSATGGSAASAALDFLSDENSILQIRSRLSQTNSGEFPNFEALLKVESRSSLPSDTTVIICRPLRR